MASKVDPVVSEFNVFTTLVTGASDLTALTLSATAADYDWSGLSLQFKRGSDARVTNPKAAIIAPYAGITSAHDGYQSTPVAVGDIYYFRTTGGTEVSGTVKSVHNLPFTSSVETDTKIIEFEEKLTDDVATYTFEKTYDDNDYFWALEHNFDVKLRVIDDTDRNVTLLGNGRQFLGVLHSDGGWMLTDMASSGSQCVVPYDDGTLKLIGHNSASTYCTQYDTQGAAIAAYVTTLNAPTIRTGVNDTNHFFIDSGVDGGVGG